MKKIAIATAVMFGLLAASSSAQAATTDYGDYIAGNAPGVLVVKFPDGATRRIDAATYAGCVAPAVDDCVPAVWMNAGHPSDGIWEVTLFLGYPYVSSCCFRIVVLIDGWSESQTWTACSPAVVAVSWTLNTNTQSWTSACNAVTAI